MINLHFSIERWKWNPKYELYVSTHGRFRNSNKKLVDIKIGHKSGYCTVYAGGEVHGFVLVHRAVLGTWRPCKGMDALTVDHNDHNKRNNRLDNLEWVTQEENLRRADADRIVVAIDGEVDKVQVNITPKTTNPTSKYKYRIEAAKGLWLTIEQLVELLKNTNGATSQDNTKTMEQKLVDAICHNKQSIYGIQLRGHTKEAQCEKE